MNVLRVFAPWHRIRGIQRTSNYDYGKRRKDFVALKAKKHRFFQNEVPNHVEYCN